LETGMVGRQRGYSISMTFDANDRSGARPTRYKSSQLLCRHVVAAGIHLPFKDDRRCGGAVYRFAKNDFPRTLIE
jgi:hypothetical protein